MIQQKNEKSEKSSLLLNFPFPALFPSLFRAEPPALLAAQVPALCLLDAMMVRRKS
jgi:hypothetical protein